MEDSTTGTILKCPPGYDKDVWDALPQEIRDELSKSAPPPSTTSSKGSLPMLKQQRISFKQHHDIDPSALLFVDKSFPASSESINGLQTISKDIGNNKKVESIKCKCSPPRIAIMKQVQKDGINQGKYYLTCPQRSCNFFAWAEEKLTSALSQQYHKTSYEWIRFSPSQGYRMNSNNGFRPSDILQGSVGDCWFLSALSIIAEHNHLIERVVLDRINIPDDCRCRFNLMIDGEWQIIEVDTLLPCKKNRNSELEKAVSEKGGNDEVDVDDSITLVESKSKKRKHQTYEESVKLAFSRCASHFLWVPLLEKAYAKAHGSYFAISGGYISEAFLDLTGLPTETINFNHSEFDSERTW